MNNMEHWNTWKSVPRPYLKKINGGRLSGMSDISPVWRYQVLTEAFGPCGVGWKYTVTDKRTQEYGNEIACFVDIDLFIKVDGAWSDAIPGTGGAMFVANEKSGPRVSDECYKMALTDALSVACKALGIAADVYMGHNDGKYPTQSADAPTAPPQAPTQAPAKPPDKSAAQPAAVDQVFARGELVTPEMLAPVEAACKADPELAARLRRIYGRYGYHRASDIRIIDWDTIKAEWAAGYNTTLPDILK